MRTLACTLVLLGLTFPATLAEPFGLIPAGLNQIPGFGLATSATKMANQATKTMLGGAASMTKNVPMVGNAVGATSEFYNEATTVRGAIRIIASTTYNLVNLIGRSNIVQLVKMFRDALMAALEMAKKILLQRLASTPIVGDSFKSGDDILQGMMKLGQAAGIPAMPIQATYTAFLLIVNGLLSAIPLK